VGGTILTSNSDVTSSKFGGQPGALSNNRKAFEADCFDCKSVTHCGKSAYRSEKINCVKQAFLFEVQMTEKRDFRMPFITAGVTE